MKQERKGKKQNKTQKSCGGGRQEKLVNDHIHKIKIKSFHNTFLFAKLKTYRRSHLFNKYLILHSAELVLLTYLSLMDTRKSLGVEENNS